MCLFKDPIKLKKIKLLDWQNKAMPDVMEELSTDSRRVLLTVPTAGGKTIMAANVMQKYVKSGKRCMFICDRIVLINQSKEVFESLGMRCDILQGSNSTYTNAPVIVASQQTLVRRSIPKDIDIWINDECHISFKSFKDLVYKSNVTLLGLSATPFASGLKELYPKFICPTTMKNLVEEGIIVPPRFKMCVRIDMAGSKKVAGEFSEREIEERAAGLTGDVVQEYINHANNKAIAFCATIKQCIALADEFNSKGISAGVFCADTTPEERKELINIFSKNDRELMVLVSVQALATGFNSPNVMTVIDCRPLSKSFTTWVQSIGRGLRSYPGKKFCQVLDFTGNVNVFASDFEDLYLYGVRDLLDGEKKERPRSEKEREDKKESSPCPKCKVNLWVKSENTYKCLACGHTMPLDQEEFKTQKHSYEVKEVDIFKSMPGKTNKSLWIEVCSYVLNTSVWKPGIKPEVMLSRSRAIYHSLTGNFPNFKENFTPLRNYSPMPSVLHQIKQQEALYKAKTGRGL